MKKLLSVILAIVFAACLSVVACAQTDDTGTLQDIKINSIVVVFNASNKTIEISIDKDYADVFTGLKVKFNSLSVSKYTENGEEIVFKYTSVTSKAQTIQALATAADGSSIVSEIVVCNIPAYDGTAGKRYIQYINTDVGDANMDGITDVKDIVRIKKIIIGKESSNAAADFGKDSIVTTLDLVTLSKIIVSKNYGMAMHTVTFAEEDGTVMETVILPDGFGVKPTVDTKKDGYTFLGWSALAQNVHQDMTIYARYEADDIYTDWPEGFE